jgi:hypothetical protein
MCSHINYLLFRHIVHLYLIDDLFDHLYSTYQNLTARSFTDIVIDQYMTIACRLNIGRPIEDHIDKYVSFRISKRILIKQECDICQLANMTNKITINHSHQKWTFPLYYCSSCFLHIYSVYYDREMLIRL